MNGDSISVISFNIFNCDGSITNHANNFPSNIDLQPYAYSVSILNNSVDERYGDLIASVIVRATMQKNKIGFMVLLKKSLAEQRELVHVLKDTLVFFNIIDMLSFTEC